jgi:uncharacterized protein (TIGR02996 family)
VSQRLALLKSILAAPNDDLPRLVFADWLDENGTSDADRARAEYLRLSIAAEEAATNTPKVYAWMKPNLQRLLPTVAALGRLKFRRVGARGLSLKIGEPDPDGAVTMVTIFYTRGFACRIEYRPDVYERMWQVFATDEPLAIHRPLGAFSGEGRDADGKYCSIRPEKWGEDVYRRLSGFSEERPWYGKLFRDSTPMSLAGQYDPEAIACEGQWEGCKSHLRVAVATAMTARAREFAGLA